MSTTSPPTPTRSNSHSARQMLKDITTRSSMASDLLIANLQNPNPSPAHRGLPHQSSHPSSSFPTGSGKNTVSPKGEGASAGTPRNQKSSGNLNNNNNPSVTFENDPSSPKTKNLFKKNIVGDLFGTSYGEHSLMGFMYRSRIIEKTDNKVKTQEKKEENLQVDSVVSSNEIMETDSDSDQDTKMLKNMNPKQQLAVTIKNWSVFPENDDHLIKEGAVYALIALAHMDDSTIRKCCASSFFHLSSREKNREELLAIGTTAGVITLAMQARNWKVAKLCALTLCNLSMQVHGEAIMAKEGAILALVVLLGIKGQSLLPICVQALYNMTSAEDHFKGIERIIKALLNMSSVGFDYSDFLVKALVNCARYSWLRLRIIEDGGINSLHALLPNLPTAENRAELVFNILTALRSLSESSGCRQEMLLKGTVELLNTLLPYSDEKDKLLIIKILHNFLQAPLTLSLTAFETSTFIAFSIVKETSFTSTIQYCAACFHIVTKEKLRGLRHLAAPIITAMSILLKSSDAITQFFGISAAGNLFFDNLCDEDEKIEQLVKFFVDNGAGIIDSAAKQALALALAKLSQEVKYLEVIEKLQLLDKVLRLLIDLREAHRDSLLLQESCCIAICRISLRMKEAIVEEGKQRIASIFLDMLQTNDQYVLTSTISGIRALGSSGLCHKELLADRALLPKIASIIHRFQHEIELCRFGCAVLAVFSYDLTAHDILADRVILNVLFANINSEDPITRELVANTVCNLSMHSLASQTMISMNVVEVLGQLSSSTSETILDLCAKSLCNLTCFPALHTLVIQNHVLEILLMISLVRTVSSQTKCNCAKALLNLITDENLSFITNSGAVRIFASLSTIPFPPVQSVCSKGFHVLTSNRLRRSEMVKVRTVLQSLFHMIKSATTTMSSNVKIRLGMSIINLLSCPASNAEAISAGALSCLKIIVTMEFEELREAVARIVLNLALDDKFHPILLREPIIPILILVLQKHVTPISFAVAINGLSCLSQIPPFKKVLLRDLALEALIGMILTGKVGDPAICHEICRTWTHLSYAMEQAETIIRSGRLGVALEILHRSGLAAQPDTQTLIILLVRNLSESLKARNFIVEQDMFQLLVKILLEDSDKIIRQDPTTASSTASSQDHPSGIKSLGYAAMVKIVYNLTMISPLHEQLVSQGLMHLIQYICLPLQYQHYEAQRGSGNNNNSHLEGSLSSVSDRLPLSPSGGSVKSLHSTDSSSHNSLNNSNNRGVTSASFISPSRPNSQHRNERKFQSFAVTSTEELPEDISGSGDSKLLDFRKRSTFRLFFTPDEVDLIATALQLLSHSPSCHEAMVRGEVMAIFKSLIFSDITERSKREIAETLSQISQSKACREDLVDQGACELLIALSITGDANTQGHCATALAYLSEITKVQKGVVASLLLLSLNLEDAKNVAFNSNDLLSAAMIQPRTHSINAATLTNPISTTATPTNAATAAANAAAVVNNLPKINTTASAAVPDPATKTGGQSLTSLLRDLMTDKKRFDSYLEALQRNNHENLAQNDFVPKTPKKIFTESPSARGGQRPGRSGSEMQQSRLNAIPSLELHLTAPYTRLAVSPFHQHLLEVEEAALLKTNFEDFTYRPPESCEGYKPQFAGLSKKRLADLPLPGIPPDRDLEPPNRHDELLKIPVNQEPLAKDLRAPTYLDHHKSVASEGLPGSASLELNRTDSRGGNDSIRSGDDGNKLLGSNSLEQSYGSGSGSGNNPSASPNSRKSAAQRATAKQQRGGSSDLLGKKNALDPRSPLLQSNNNLFKSNNKDKNKTDNSNKISVRAGVKSLPKLTTVNRHHSGESANYSISEEVDNEDENSQSSLPPNQKRKSGIER